MDGSPEHVAGCRRQTAIYEEPPDVLPPYTTLEGHTMTREPDTHEYQSLGLHVINSPSQQGGKDVPAYYENCVMDTANELYLLPI